MYTFNVINLMNKSISEIQQLLSSNQLEKALKICQRTLKEEPNNLVLHKLLSHVYGLKEEFPKAIDVIKSIIPHYPDDFDLNNNLGFYYLKSEELELAQHFIDKAKYINPESAVPHHNAADLFMFLRKFDLAEEEINKALLIHGRHYTDYSAYIPSLLLRIQIFIANKKQKEAVEFILKYLNKSFNSEIFLQLVQIDKNSVTPKMIQSCEEMLQQKLFQSNMEKFKHLVPLYFSLAYFYEKENKKKSEEYFLKANQEIFSIQRLNMLNFQKKINVLIETYDQIQNFNIENISLGSSNYFIVGMPRSGTTLMESLLTANKEVFAGGELNALNQLINKNLIDHQEDSLKKLQFIGESYIRITDYIKNNYKSLVDKMPMNASYVGFIRKCLPGSKIIILVRQPWDVAISLFKQRYVTNIAYSSSFFNIGIYMANFEAIMTFWNQFEIVQQNVLTVQYEKLVQDLETQRQLVYNFLKIDDSYNPQIRERFFARTASMNQVQNNIHQSSVKKSDFSGNFSEFDDAYRSQKEYWARKGIKFSDKFLGIY